ncbi:MAG: retention module-containing protein, partial [Pseudomonadaceae bacterium]|nr:retention module-containing protein [Pseudomonadaceae bacterium]
MEAIIKSVIGQVFAISADGVKRQVFEGDRIFQGEQLLTGELSAVTLQTPDEETIELGNNQQWPSLTQEVNQQDADTQAEALQQAIAAGLDLTQTLPDTAAGTSQTAGPGNSGGHSFVMLETTNQQIQIEVADTISNPSVTALTQGIVQERRETSLTPQQLDPVAPSVIITADTASLQVGETTQVRFGFSEAVRGFSASTITTNGGTISALTQVDATTWTAIFTRTPSGAPGIGLAAGSYTDQVGNPGRAASLTINGAPQANDISVSADENLRLDGNVPAANDPDGSVVRYTLISDTSAGSLTFNSNGSYSFNPGSDFDDLAVGTTRQVTFSYNATDDNDAVSAPATVTITITGRNDAPVSSNLALTTDEDVSVSGAISANDPDGDTLSYIVTGNPANGTVVLNPATG